jgi:hypothetical protein
MTNNVPYVGRFRRIIDYTVRAREKDMMGNMRRRLEKIAKDFNARKAV